MDPASVPDSSTALATMVDRTVASSSVEFTACVTSPRARSSLTDCASSRLRVSTSCTRLALLLQAGVGFLQLPRHRIELVGERFELVPGLDGDALAEIAAAQPRGTRSQRL